MADQNELTKWLLSKREVILKFKEFDWPKRYAPDLFDFSCKLQFNGFEAKGRGVDHNQELALEKATSEALERLVCQKLQIGTKGVSLSFKYDSKSHAENETLERYFLFKHLEEKVPFVEISESLPVRRNFEEKNPGSSLRFFRMHTGEGVGIISKIESESSFYGFSYSGDLNRSAKRSFFEALANYAKWKDDKAGFSKEIEDKNFWHLKPAFLDQMNRLTNEAKPLSPQFSLPYVETEHIKCPFEEMDDPRLKIYRASVRQ